MTLLATQVPLETWLSATWDEFVQIADDPASAKRKSYYYKGKMRMEPMSTGADHSKDHAVIIFAINLFATLRGLPVNAHDGCSYRKVGIQEFQPDASYYVGENVDAIPWGTRVVDLNRYPVPDLVIEISDTSLADDKGEKRIQYEMLGIAEYWIVDVQNLQIIAWAIAPDHSSRPITVSQVLTGLELVTIAEAIRRSRTDNQAVVGAWLMEQFRCSDHPSPE
jgi:Uma2 family endonuclease